MANDTLKGFASVQERVAFQNALIEAEKKTGQIARQTAAVLGPCVFQTRWPAPCSTQKTSTTEG